MLFNSIEFLFCFLPIVFLGFLLLQWTGKERLVVFWLTLGSLFFYAWYNPVYLALLLFSVTINFYLGTVLAKHRGRDGRPWLLLGIIFNVGLLGYFKYANFFVENINHVLDTGFNLENIVLPLAISFYTFSQITYLVDTSKGLAEPHGYLDFLLFVSYFPHLIAGPIVHHGELLGQFRNLGKRGNLARNLALGGSMISIGLFKKVVIADSLALFATPVFTMASNGEPIHSLEVIAGTFSYAFQLYFDFSGYSDMAIGLSCLFGIKLPVNFHSPFRAQNISDFWRMWHATLSRFLRDYVYAPMGGFACSPNRQRFNLFTTMFVGGVWHGAGWTFVAYGFCHGVYVVTHQLWRIKVSGPLGLVGNPYYKSAAQVVTFLVVSFTLVLFRSDSIPTAAHIYASLFNLGDAAFGPGYLAQLERANMFRLARVFSDAVPAVALVFSCLVLALLACWVLPSTFQLFENHDVAINKPRAGRPAVWGLTWQASMSWALLIAALTLASLLNLTQVSEFLYFQF